MVEKCTVGCLYNMKKEYKNHVILYLKNKKFMFSQNLYKYLYRSRRKDKRKGMKRCLFY